jgi:hypothetical protein
MMPPLNDAAVDDGAERAPRLTSSVPLFMDVLAHVKETSLLVL